MACSILDTVHENFGKQCRHKLYAADFSISYWSALFNKTKIFRDKIQTNLKTSTLFCGRRKGDFTVRLILAFNCEHCRYTLRLLAISSRFVIFHMRIK